MRYAPDIAATLARLREYYEERPMDRIYASMAVPSATRAAYARDHEGGYCQWPDVAERTAFWDACLREHTPVRDDSVPCAYLSEMDQGLYGALLGGEVRFLCDHASGWISSMVPPILTDWAEVDGLGFTTDHPWWTRYQRYLDAFVAAAAGKFALSHFILINHLNLAFELMGATATYEAVIDVPEVVERVVELAHDLNASVQEEFFARVPLVAGGTASIMAQWVPGRVVSESVDPFHMTSVDYFERWGRGALERMFARFDGGVVHIHGNGRHLLHAVSTVAGLKQMCVCDDRGYPRACDILPEIRRQVGNMPFSCNVPFADFCRALEEHRLVGGVFYGVGGVPDVDTANRLMDRVRAYREVN